MALPPEPSAARLESANRTPRTSPHAHATVVGAGVSGLSCAVRLQKAGIPTRIVTRAPPLETTSAVAGAIWLPYHVGPRDRALAWALRSLESFRELEGDAATGVRAIEHVDLARDDAAAPWWCEALAGVRAARASELPAGWTCGWVAPVAVVETPIYLRWLRARFEAGGGTIEVDPRGVSDLAQLAAPGGVVVNCAGLGARRLTGDTDLHPVRGQVVRVRDPGLVRAASALGDGPPAYAIPRREDCILGGTSEPFPDRDADAISTVVDERKSAAIRARAGALDARLATAPILDARVGLRPARSGVRLELEDRGGAPVVHDYGHGGAGVTLSWGCADEVLELVRQALA